METLTEKGNKKNPAQLSLTWLLFFLLKFMLGPRMSVAFFYLLDLPPLSVWSREISRIHIHPANAKVAAA